jgi:hypothetical protein
LTPCSPWGEMKLHIKWLAFANRSYYPSVASFLPPPIRSKKTLIYRYIIEMCIPTL